MKSMQNEKVAIVVQGYYEKKSNQCICIYVLDKKKSIVIPLEANNFKEAEEIIGAVGEILGKYEDQNYQIKFSHKTDFDVTKYAPFKPTKNNVFQKLGKHTICLN